MLTKTAKAAGVWALASTVLQKPTEISSTFERNAIGGRLAAEELWVNRRIGVELGSEQVAGAKGSSPNR
jgi:hypothetical protein